MKSCSNIVSLLDERLSRIVFKRSDDVLCANVCCVCDCLLEPTKIKFICVEKLSETRCKLKCHRTDINENIMSQLYKYYSYVGEMSESWMTGEYLISPRSCVRRVNKRKRRNNKPIVEYMICPSCKNAVEQRDFPIRGISNFLIGGLPTELNDVTDVEWAFVSNNRSHAHFLMYQGGASKKIKGYHSLLKTDVQKVSNCMTLIESLSSTDHIKVVLCGHFTSRQRERVKKRSEININRVKRLLSWLKENNQQYASLAQVDIEHLQIPQIEILHTNNDDEESENENVEVIEDFRVVFPDGLVDERTGGLSGAREFVEVVEKVRKAGGDVELVSRTLDQVVPDYKDQNIVRAFPKVFPFGVGGPSDIRVNSDGEPAAKMQLCDYIKYISKLSNPVLHEQLVSLVFFSIVVKQNIVKSSCYRSRVNVNLTSSIADLTAKELLEATNNNSHGLHNNTSGAHELMRMVESVSDYIPHSDRAARKARGNIEALCSAMGNMTYFLTVTPDDENGIEVQAYSGTDIDISDGISIASMSSEELRRRAVWRRKLSFRYPGLCAFYFSQVLDIINEVVVGWDFYNNKPVEGGGFFGVPKAVTNTIEEQGRDRLHVHIGIWTDFMQNCLHTLLTGYDSTSTGVRSKTKNRSKAKKAIEKEFDRNNNNTRINRI